VTLKYGHSRSFKLVPFESLGAVSYSPSIVTMVSSCIYCEIKRDIGPTSWFFPYPLHSTPPFGVEKPEWWGYSTVKNIENMCNRLDRILVCVGRPGRGYFPATYILQSYNWHVTLRLTVFEIFGVKWPKFRPKISRLGIPWSPPQKKKRPALDWCVPSCKI